MRFSSLPDQTEPSAASHFGTGQVLIGVSIWHGGCSWSLRHQTGPSDMISRIALTAAALLLGSTTAFADDYSNAASYNHGYGMGAGEENQSINPSLRDSNGNLTNVNGQFTSSSFSSASGMHMSSSGSQLANLGGGGSNS